MRDRCPDGEPVTVRLDILDIRELEPHAPALAGSLCENRRRRMNAYLRPDDRLRCLGGGLLLRRALGTDDLPANPYGKPTLPPEYAAARCRFNLSHSGDYVVLALCEETVGVDIEEMGELAYAQLSKICFHPEEQALLDRAPQRDRKLLFYRLWTLKESYMKATGLGLSMAPDSFAIRPDDAGGAMLSAQPAYRFQTQVFLSDYMLSVCVAAPRPLIVSCRRCRASDLCADAAAGMSRMPCVEGREYDI